MASLRDISRSLRRRLVAVVAVAGLAMVFAWQGLDRANAETSTSASAKDAEGKKKVDSAAAKLAKMAKTFYRKLGNLRPVDSKTKTQDDYYVTCTAELNLETRQADIRFEVRQGQQTVADFLADYVLNPPDKTMRNWHVIGRFSDGTQAEAATEAIRKRYDEMVAYRAELMRQYRAKKTVRC